MVRSRPDFRGIGDLGFGRQCHYQVLSDYTTVATEMNETCLAAEQESNLVFISGPDCEDNL
jgi:hypothetical protein